MVDIYQQQTTAARAQLLAWIAALWQSLPDYRNQSMRDFSTQAVPLVNAAMGHTQALTSAYLASRAAAAGASATPAAVPLLSVADVRGGADAAQVYERPFHLVWRMLHDGSPVAQAVQAGEARVVSLAATDLQLAKTHTTQKTLAKTRHIAGYRRVLEGPHSCALCIVAATKVYHKAELMPIHPGCDCSVDPLFDGETGDGITLDPALLDAAHATIAAQFGADSTAAREIRGALTARGNPVLYKDVLITHDHGELGPILGLRGQRYLGPSDIAA